MPYSLEQHIAKLEEYADWLGVCDPISQNDGLQFRELIEWLKQQRDSDDKSPQPREAS